MTFACTWDIDCVPPTALDEFFLQFVHQISELLGRQAVTALLLHDDNIVGRALHLVVVAAIWGNSDCLSSQENVIVWGRALHCKQTVEHR